MVTLRIMIPNRMSPTAPAGGRGRHLSLPDRLWLGISSRKTWIEICRSVDLPKMFCGEAAEYQLMLKTNCEKLVEKGQQASKMVVDSCSPRGGVDENSGSEYELNN